jgi:hypothetical protein
LTPVATPQRFDWRVAPSASPGAASGDAIREHSHSPSAFHFPIVIREPRLPSALVPLTLLAIRKDHRSAIVRAIPPQSPAIPTDHGILPAKTVKTISAINSISSPITD